jgi:hypothetical protein
MRGLQKSHTGLDFFDESVAMLRLGVAEMDRPSRVSSLSLGDKNEGSRVQKGGRRLRKCAMYLGLTWRPAPYGGPSLRPLLAGMNVAVILAAC